MSSFQFARNVLSHQYSHEQIKPQAVSNWQGPFPLPRELVRYYKDFGPLDMEWRFLPKPFYFPSLKDLWQYQVGFGFDPRLKKLKRGWQPNWIAIADNGEQTVIYCMKTGHVLIDFEGEDNWVPVLFFPDLESMVQVFCLLSDICHRAEIDFKKNIASEALIPINLREAAFIRLSELTGDLESAKAILKIIGWY